MEFISLAPWRIRSSSLGSSHEASGTSHPDVSTAPGEERSEPPSPRPQRTLGHAAGTCRQVEPTHSPRDLARTGSGRASREGLGPTP